MSGKISYEDFLEKYITVLSDEQYNKVEDYILGLRTSVTFSDEEVEELDKKLLLLKALKNRRAFNTEKEIIELIKLRQDGVITEEEYQAQKKKLLDK